MVLEVSMMVFLAGVNAGWGQVVLPNTDNVPFLDLDTVMFTLPKLICCLLVICIYFYVSFHQKST
jgi:hypothetical protein